MKPIPNNIGEYLVYSPTSPSGLTWRKNNKVAGSIEDNGYWVVNFNYKLYKIHRVIWELEVGRIPSGRFIDHVDGNKANNRLDNLRLASKVENGYNRKMNSNNKSGVKGVYWRADHKKWRAVISFNKKKINLGNFNTISEAEKAISSARIELHKEFTNHG